MVSPRQDFSLSLKEGVKAEQELIMRGGLVVPPHPNQGLDPLTWCPGGPRPDDQGLDPLTWCPREEAPKTEDPHAPGAKLDSEKPEADLLQDFSLALKEVAKVATFGRRKYSLRGWELIDDPVRRYSAAMIRHWLDEKKEDTDKESGILHAAHLAWNALARLCFIVKEREKYHDKN